MERVCWLTIRTSSSFSTHASKHPNDLICGPHCCVFNSTVYSEGVKKKERKKNNNRLGLPLHESQPGGHLAVYQQLCSQYSYVT